MNISNVSLLVEFHKIYYTIHHLQFRDQGEIKEQGTHDELIRGNGIYTKLWSHQSGGFIGFD